MTKAGRASRIVMVGLAVWSAAAAGLHAQATGGESAGIGSVPDAPPPQQDTSGDGAAIPLNQVGAAPTAVAPPSLDIVPEFSGRLYGFIDSFFEWDAPTPDSTDGSRVVYSENKPEFDLFNFNLMVQGTILGSFRYFVNLNAPGSGSPTEDAPIKLRNAWVEAPLYGELFVVRAGKTYRRFGLYNEILDATPTFIGIEPPELFDKDHLLLTRTTNLMIHGQQPLPADLMLRYALHTGNDEAAELSLPLGADLRLERSTLGTQLTVGTSFYWTGGKSGPSVAVGDGVPIGGVASWMDTDQFIVFGGFVGLELGGFVLQAEGWQARHNAERNPEEFLKLLDADVGLIDTQRRRLKLDAIDLDPNGDGSTSPDEYAAAVNGVTKAVSYNVTTAYVRTAYRFDIPVEGLTDGIQVVPYAQLDWYQNPEIVANKDYGGDNEAGLSDDGMFFKETLGVIFKPISAVALKVDGSTHHQFFNQQFTIYPELRISFSYYWELANQ